jgi:hypothetical protein
VDVARGWSATTPPPRKGSQALSMPRNQDLQKPSPRGRPRALSAEQLGLVRDLARAGKTDKQIAAALGVSPMTVWRARREHGIPPGAAGWGGSRPGAGRKPAGGKKAKKAHAPRRLAASDLDMVLWNRQHYTTTPAGVLCGDELVKQSGRPGCPRRYRPRLGIAPGRAGRKGRGGGFVDPAARAAWAAAARR